MIKRRTFILTSLIAALGLILIKFKKQVKLLVSRLDQHPRGSYEFKEVPARIFVSQNGTPQQNVAKVIDMMGGIQKLIDKKDIVVLKPNMQWWNQGRTNLAAMKGFIDLVLSIPGFAGEIIIAENNHFMDNELPDSEKDNVRGWTHMSEINGDIDGTNHSVNTLIDMYHRQGNNNVTKYHWRDAGKKLDIWGNGQGGRRVNGPSECDGYVWTDEEFLFTGFLALKTWKVKMTYPIFTSAFSGITIDFLNGPYMRDGNGGGQYLKNRKLKFINFAVLNDHGKDTGISSSLKNYMGVTDLSCGYWGLEPQGYANVHFVGEQYYLYARAGAIAHFMKTIRKADLNIVTAEWLGWGHRTDVKRATLMRTILASTDPIALDYYGAKYLMFPLSKNSEYHDPDDINSSVRKFLDFALETYEEGTLAESQMSIKKFDFRDAMA